MSNQQHRPDSSYHSRKPRRYSTADGNYAGGSQQYMDLSTMGELAFNAGNMALRTQNQSDAQGHITSRSGLPGGINPPPTKKHRRDPPPTRTHTYGPRTNRPYDDVDHADEALGSGFLSQRHTMRPPSSRNRTNQSPTRPVAYRSQTQWSHDSGYQTYGYLGPRSGFQFDFQPQSQSQSQYSRPRSVARSTNKQSFGGRPPFEFEAHEIAAAKQRDYKVGDIIQFEYICQAPINPAWEWTDNSRSKWRYSAPNVEFVPSKDNNLVPDKHLTNPAVYMQHRWGVISAIYENQPFRGVTAKVFAEYTYSGRGLARPEGGYQGAAYCSEHLPIMHHDEACKIEQSVGNWNANPANQHNLLSLDDQNSHPCAPWSSVLRTTPGSSHHPVKKSMIRLTGEVGVYLQDPRVRKVGELDEASTTRLREMSLKVLEMMSTRPTDRYAVDVSKYPWLENLDRFSKRRQQERADKQTASAQTESRPQSKKKRRLSDGGDSSPSPSSPVADLQSSLRQVDRICDGLGPGGRRQMLERLSERVRLEGDEEDGEIIEQ